MKKGAILTPRYNSVLNEIKFTLIWVPIGKKQSKPFIAVIDKRHNAIYFRTELSAMELLSKIAFSGLCIIYSAIFATLILQVPIVAWCDACQFLEDNTEILYTRIA